MSIYEPGTLKEIQSWVSSRIESQDLFRICGNCSRNLTPASRNSDTIPADILSLKNMQYVRTFFNPENLLNPGKLFPQPGRCAESKSGTSHNRNAVLDKTKIVGVKSGIEV